MENHILLERRHAEFSAARLQRSVQGLARAGTSNTGCLPAVGDQPALHKVDGENGMAAVAAPLALRSPERRPPTDARRQRLRHLIDALHTQLPALQHEEASERFWRRHVRCGADLAPSAQLSRHSSKDMKLHGDH